MAAILAAVRRDKILTFLQERASATVNELSGLCDVSEVTIRQDLNQLSDEGLLVRTRGGALLANRNAKESTFAVRQELNAAAKQRIGELAAEMVDSGDTVFIDSSSTGVSVARALAARRELLDVTVITNGLYAALELVGHRHFSTIVAGGHMDPKAASLTGSFAWKHLERVTANIGFFGTRGLSLAYGVTELNIHEADVKQMMVARCLDVVIVTDSSKFDDASLVTFAEVSNINHLVTDDAAPSEVLNELRERGITIVLASL